MSHLLHRSIALGNALSHSFLDEINFQQSKSCRMTFMQCHCAASEKSFVDRFRYVNQSKSLLKCPSPEGLPGKFELQAASHYK